MTEKNKPSFFDAVYKLGGDADVRDFYDEWAGAYDKEVTDGGYATPMRCAQALAATDLPKDAGLLDMGCGTGLSGAAFAEHGFGVIDGCDLSPGMLAEAAKRGVYRKLYTADEMPDALYDAVAAVGVVSPGAGPPELLDTTIAHLRPGGLMVFSLNAHAFEDPAYLAKLEEVTGSGPMTLLSEANGPHLPALGLTSTVYVLRKDG